MEAEKFYKLRIVPFLFIETKYLVIDVFGRTYCVARDDDLQRSVERKENDFLLTFWSWLFVSSLISLTSGMVIPPSIYTIRRE